MSGVCVFVYLFFPLSDFSFCCVLISLFAVLSFLSVAFLLQDEIMVSSVCVCVCGCVCAGSVTVWDSVHVWKWAVMRMCLWLYALHTSGYAYQYIFKHVCLVCVLDCSREIPECVWMYTSMKRASCWLTVNGQVAVVGNAWLLPFTLSFLSCILPASTHTHTHTHTHTRTHTDAHTHTHTLTVKEG